MLILIGLPIAIILLIVLIELPTFAPKGTVAARAEQRTKREAEQWLFAVVLMPLINVVLGFFGFIALIVFCSLIGV